MRRISREVVWFDYVQSLKLWAFLMVMFSLVRLSFILFNGAGVDFSYEEFFKAMVNGMRFDMKFALIPIIPLFVLDLFIYDARFKHRVKLVLGVVFSMVILMAGVGYIGFYREYHDIFNEWLFGLFKDDFWAIILTIWHDYPIVKIVVGLILLCVVILFFVKKILSVDIKKVSNLKFSLSILLFLLFIKIAITGNFLDFRTLSRKDTAVTGVAFLNKAVYNPFYALYSACRDETKRQSGRGLEAFIADGDIKKALRVLYPESDGNCISDWIKKEALGPQISRPRHIFLLVMESQDSWPLLAEHKELQLAPNLSSLAQKGIWFKNFLPSGVGTMPALNTLILGMPEVGLESQYQVASSEAFQTSIAMIMKRLGYKTNLFYGGYLSWRKLGDFATKQGFDEVYGIGKIPQLKGNEWGVNDELLFEFVEKTIAASEGETFNLIMTTSNHPPFSVDLKKEGWTGENKELGHSWYGDKCLGKFIESTEGMDALFLITGDHWSRRFPTSQPSLFERSSVPLVIYGKHLDLKVPDARVGSHIDIIPTLVELVAPKGFVYHALGKNLFAESRRAFGANGVIITAEDIFTLEDAPKHLLEEYNALHAIGWWRIKYGDRISNE